MRLSRNLITTTLKTQDYKYIAAATASEALQQATIHAPDVMLLDLGLPDLDGIEVIRRIRSWSAMPIIVISARSEDSDKIEAWTARRRLPDETVLGRGAAGAAAGNVPPHLDAAKRRRLFGFYQR